MSLLNTPPVRSAESGRTRIKGLKVKYNPDSDFYRQLKNRIDQYFITTGSSLRDVPQMYLKTVIILAWLSLSYVLLIFVANTWWQVALLAVSLGLAMAGIGFNVQHDGGHYAYSNRRSINHLMSMTLDLLGGSSYLWRLKHNLHHNYPNVVGADEDIDLVPLAHLSPDQPLYKLHRFQHIYIWFFYCLLPFQWHFISDFKNLVRGHIGGHPIIRPRGWDLVIFLTGKGLFFSLAFFVPLVFHPPLFVLASYTLTSAVLGLTLSVVFQLAHCVEEASFPKPIEGTNRMDTSWAAHQIETTVDFARHNQFWTWYLGGLNFQIEHHLFPNISHYHYPAISRIVEELCKEFDIKYVAHKTLARAIVSHFRLLRLN